MSKPYVVQAWKRDDGKGTQPEEIGEAFSSDLSTRENKLYKILIVDDEAVNRQLMHDLLLTEGYQTREVINGLEALKLVSEYEPDLILLDVNMPGMDGFDVALKLKRNPATHHIPIIMVTGLSNRDDQMRGLGVGAEDYLAKPFDATELKIRVRNLLRMKSLHDFVKNHNRMLESEVQQRTHELKESVIDSIHTLMRAAEYRDDKTGEHVQRISHYCKFLSEQLGMGGDFCQTIFHASPMHDVGKIGIPDDILLKAGVLDADEWEIMKTHTTIGANILASGTSPYMEMGRQIALNHHECWDGTGYPAGLRQEHIPLAARIMSICDVYDALRSKRPYNSAFDHAIAVDIITKGDGRTTPQHFDPSILAGFVKAAATFDDIYVSHID